MAYIYILTNIQNGKQYIGKTHRSFDVRLSQHLSSAKHKSDTAVHNAIRKYGIENFHIECLQVSDKLVNLWEKHLIVSWQSKAPHGYNLTDGGDGVKNLSEVSKRKISEAQKRRIYTDEIKNNMSLGCRNNRNFTGKNNPFAKPIMLIHPDGAEEKFDCVSYAIRKYKLNSSNLYNRGNSKGFRKRELMK